MNTLRIGQSFSMRVGILLVACACAATSWAEQTFPDAPAAKPNEQAGPPRPAAPTPTGLRGREELEADIRALELERASLLAKFASAHPDVRLVERKLQARRQQLEALGPASVK